MIEIISSAAIYLERETGGILSGKNFKIIVYVMLRTRPLSGGHGYVLIGHLLKEGVIITGYTRFENITGVKMFLDLAAFPDVGYVGVILCLYGSNDFTGAEKTVFFLEGQLVAVAGEVDIQNAGVIGEDGNAVCRTRC